MWGFEEPVRPFRSVSSFLHAWEKKKEAGVAQRSIALLYKSLHEASAELLWRCKLLASLRDFQRERYSDQVIWCGGEPRSHPVTALRPPHAGFLSSFSGNAEEELALKPAVLKAKSHLLSPSDRGPL